MAEIKKPPESVAIVAMGQSSRTYLNLASVRGDRHRIADETWAINAMGGVIDHDLLFHMDDCKVQEARAKRDPEGNVAGMLQWLKNHPKFITSKIYPDYRGAVEFPLQEVVNTIGTTYFNNTVAYAVAFAMYIGVKKISLYGCDYSYANSHKSESGRGCVEFLLGMAAAKGIRIEVAADSSLLDANVPDNIKPYGYDAYDMKFAQTDNGVIVEKQERNQLPSPEEIERRYKHEE
jgi:hypothetical protein